MTNLLSKSLIAHLAVSLVIGLSTFAAGQTRVPMSPVDPPVAPIAIPGNDLERFIAVDPKVNASLCITQGNVKVNGWSRSEFRVLVRGGLKFAFQIQVKDPKTELPQLIRVVGAETKGKYASSSECIWGETIEIDAPVNSTINIKGRNVNVSVDTVRKADVKIVGGDVSFRNVAEGINAMTGQGDLSIESSTGPMSLETTTGNIVVFDSRTREIGDVFKAKTHGGNLSLQQLGFRQVEVNSISGSVLFTGDVIDGGNYVMTTTNGSIRLQVPQVTSCQFNAIFSSGSFTSDLPFKVITENISEGSVKNIVGKFGSGGDARLKLSTSLGTISVKKQ